MIRLIIIILISNLFSISYVCCQSSKTTNMPQNNFDENVYQIAEYKPEFVGGSVKLQNFIYDKIEQFIDIDDKEISGRVILRFIINKEGRITNIKVVKSDFEKLNDIAVRIVESMPRWIPAMQRSYFVNFQYTMPISFTEVKKSRQLKKDSWNSPYSLISNNSRAIFNGGDEALLNYITQNKNLNNIIDKDSGFGAIPFVRLRFTVLSDGSITEIETIFATNEDYNKEAKRIVNNMPNWKPATKDDVAVEEQVVLTIDF